MNTDLATPRGPKGARLGDVVIADGSRWEVRGIDPGRREAICRLINGSHSVRRFRARAIERVERAPRTRIAKIDAELTQAGALVRTGRAA